MHVQSVQNFCFSLSNMQINDVLVNEVALWRNYACLLMLFLQSFRAFLIALSFLRKGKELIREIVL